MNEIDIRNLTRDYGNGKGVFDICLTVGRGYDRYRLPEAHRRYEKNERLFRGGKTDRLF